MKKILLIADVSNLYYCIGKRFSGRRLDYEKYLKYCVGENQLYKAIAYGADMDNSALQFRTALHHLGYETRWKEPSRYMIAGSSRENRKADWDVGMAMDAVRLMSEYDSVIFGTADGDLSECVKFIRDSGKDTQVIACGISRNLKNMVDRYEEIEEVLLK